MNLPRTHSRTCSEDGRSSFYLWLGERGHLFAGDACGVDSNLIDLYATKFGMIVVLEMHHLTSTGQAILFKPQLFEAFLACLQFSAPITKSQMSL